MSTALPNAVDSASDTGPPPSSSSLPPDPRPNTNTTTTTTITEDTNERQRKNENNDTYVLGRDMKAASRLGHQHYLWHETLAFHLHPAIASALHLVPHADAHAHAHPPSSSTVPRSWPSSSAPPPPGPGSEHHPSEPSTNNSTTTSPIVQIADVACGATSWLRSVALAYPTTTQLAGYDISLAQCPPRAWLPRNITRLREWDLYSPTLLTADMQGRYDVVHTRLIFTVVEGATDEEGVARAREVIRSLLRLVKPGGWVQWDELDVERSFILQANNRDGPGDGEDGDDAVQSDRRGGGGVSVVSGGVSDSSQVSGTRDNQAGAGPRPPLEQGHVQGHDQGLIQGPGQQAPGAAPTMARFLSILRQKGKWVAELPGLMREAGMEDVNFWQFAEREDLAMQFFENNLLKDEEMANGGLRGTEQGKRLADMVQQMWEESRAGIVVCTPKVVITARRSSVA